MSAFSNYAENKVLDHSLGTLSWTAPTVYVALYTSSPTDADTGTELTPGSLGYARQTAAFSAAASGATSNSGIITFGPCTTSNWGVITHFGIRDASTGGNLIYWGALTVSKTVTVGDTAQFLAGDIDITVD